MTQFSQAWVDAQNAKVLNGRVATKAKCIQCGVVFLSYPSRNRKFCSLECAYKNPERLAGIAEKQKKKRGSVVCSGCGVEFQVVTRGGVKYCTQTCAARHIGKRTMAMNAAEKPAKTRIEKACDNCGRIFSSWASANRRFCSSKCSATDVGGILSRVAAFRSTAWAKGNTYSRSKKQWLVLGGKRIYCRSLWEANYARYLQWLKDRGDILDWEHEPQTFWFHGIKRGVMSYLPDFKVSMVSGGHEWHEVKGWMDPRSATKLRRMKKYHPKEVVKVFGSDWFKSASRSISSIIPGWESKS